MSPEKSDRGQNIRDFVRTELEGFKTGEIMSISSNEELRIRFGYQTVGSFYPQLRKEGLIEERRELIRERGRERLVPSKQLAWVLGLIAGGGHVGVSTGAVSIFSADEKLVQSYKISTEALFHTNTQEHDMRLLKDGRSYKDVRFHNIAVARFLGDLGRSKWPQTLQTKHEWIFNNRTYVWGLLEGLFELRGHFESDSGIYYSTTYPNVANFIAELLVRGGLENPSIHYSDPNKERTLGVGVYNRRDLKIIAENIHPIIPATAERLGEFLNNSVKPRKSRVQTGQRLIQKDTGKTIRVSRLLNFVREEIERYNKGEMIGISSNEDLRTQFGYEQVNTIIYHLKNGGLFEARKVIRKHLYIKKGHTVSSDEKLKEEWLRMREILGHKPTSNDIQKLRHEDKTEINVGVYSNRFGRDGKTRSFTKAQEYLEQMVSSNI